MTVIAQGARERELLDSIRARIETTRVEVDAVENAPITTTEVVARLMRTIDQRRDLAMDIVCGATRTVEYTPDLVKATDIAAALTLLLLGDVSDIEARLRGVVEPLTCGALTPDERQGQTAALVAKLGELEEAEEREILRLEGLGFLIARRTDVRIELLLKLWDEVNEASSDDRHSLPTTCSSGAGG